MTLIVLLLTAALLLLFGFCRKQLGKLKSVSDPMFKRAAELDVRPKVCHRCIMAVPCQCQNSCRKAGCWLMCMQRWG